MRRGHRCDDASGKADVNPLHIDASLVGDVSILGPGGSVVRVRAVGAWEFFNNAGRGSRAR